MSLWIWWDLKIKKYKLLRTIDDDHKMYMSRLKSEYKRLPRKDYNIHKQNSKKNKIYRKLW